MKLFSTEKYTESHHLQTLALWRVVRIYVVVQDDEEENRDAQNVGKHSKLNIRNHGPKKK